MDLAKQHFVAQKRLAVVGVSRTRGFGNLVLHTLRERGYECFPVNAQADSVEGERCFRSLADLPAKPDGVLAIVPPAQTEKVVEDCGKLGVKQLWIQQGAESPAALRRCAELGIEEVHGACILMYTQPAGIHRFHAGLAKLFKKY